MADLIKFFFELQHQIKLYHWQTASFAQHTATDQLYIALLPLIDQFLEIYQGKYGKISLPLQASQITVIVQQLAELNMITYLKKVVSYLNALSDAQLVKQNDTDLLNLRDEMVGLINKTIYLFSFK